MAGSKTPAGALSAPDLDILGDQVTIHPGGYVAPSSATEADRERNLVEHMARFRESPLEFLREISLHVSGLGWRAYDRVIGQLIFYAGFSDNMRSMVVRSPTLQTKIRELAETRVQVEAQQGLLGRNDHDREAKRRHEIEESLREVALEMTDAMICKMESKKFIRSAYYVCTQLLTRAYHQGIHVSSEEVFRLRGVAEEAAKKKHSIIFLPSHRSHVDYVSMQIICYRLGIALPTVVAGDNLNFPVVGAFLQHAGAMWIRRSFGDDALYTALVQSYIDTLLQNGHNLECFIEGGRSRTGKLLSPKFGILSFVLDSVLSGRVEDAIICPVSTQYDKVIETESYISELLGQPKPKENLQDFLSASSVLSLKLGRVDVRFHEPWSLRQFINQQQQRIQDTLENAQVIDPRALEHRTRILRTLGYKVLSDINTVSVVMPTALIGTVLLTLRGRGVGHHELIRRVDWLSERVRSKGGRVAHFAGIPTEAVVSRGLDVLGPDLVGTVPGLPEVTYYAVDRFQLSFYRNMTIHLFISEALVSAAMYSKVKQGGGPENQSISFQELYDQVNFLSQLFRGEFIYPTAGLMKNLITTLEGLERDGVIALRRDTSGRPRDGPPNKIVAIELSAAERARGRENFDFYCFLIWPFIESIWLGSVFLMGLTPPLPERSVDAFAPRTNRRANAIQGPWLDLTKTQNTAQLLGKTLYHQGDLSYFEAVNKENLRNCFQFFEEEGIVQILRGQQKAMTPPSNSQSDASTSSNTTQGKSVPAQTSGKPTTVIRLAPDWIPSRDHSSGALVPQGSRLWSLIETIAKSRREGKNRRDDATVGSRVLKLADQLGRQLVQDGTVAAEGEEGDASVESGQDLRPLEVADSESKEASTRTKERKESRVGEDGQEKARRQGRMKRRRRKEIAIKARL